MRQLTYQHTLYACFIGYIVQAIINNFLPLLFLTFHSQYGIPLSKITFLIAFNFVLQMLIDLFSAKFIDKLGYKLSAILAHIFAFGGFVSLAVLPEIFQNPFIGILISVLIYAIGGGFIEVLISPIVEACPTANKEMAMSMLHSFYCWGAVVVVFLSTLFFSTVGIRHWKLLSLLWAIIPFANILLFAKVPVNHIIKSGEAGLNIRQLVHNKFFWLLAIVMICAGASEQAVSQWASTFAEQGLNVAKTVGDLAGPMFFSIMMGISRTIYGKFGNRIDLEKYMFYSVSLCITSYILIFISPFPILGLFGCGICGFSVGIMWPGTFSIASKEIKNGGTLMFALFALAGDIGCSLGPTVVGLASCAFDDSIQTGIFIAIIFPIVLLLCMIYRNKPLEK